MMIASGNPLAIAPVCNAGSPPASSSTAATTPCSSAQKMRCHAGGSGTPLVVMMSITRLAESDEVTKKVTTSAVAMLIEMVSSGRCSRKRNSATATSSLTAATRLPAPVSWMNSAVLPNTVNQKKVKAAGTSSTPTMNSRTVLPRDIRAMNMPTNGDQEIHQPQEHTSELQSREKLVCRLLLEKKNSGCTTEYEKPGQRTK